MWHFCFTKKWLFWLFSKQTIPVPRQLGHWDSTEFRDTLGHHYVAGMKNEISTKGTFYSRNDWVQVGVFKVR